MSRLFAEFLATFALVFAGTGAVVIDDLHGGVIGHTGIALTFGLVVLASIYAVGEVSGAHLNPAVTWGFFLAGVFPARQIAPYILSQLAGALSASLLLRVLFVHPTLGATVPDGSWSQSFLLEVVLTWFLMFVILRVATGSKETGMFAGVAIGAVVALEAMFAGPVSGASMNPARSTGPAIVSGQWAHLWLYWLAPFVGAAVAVACHRGIGPSARD